MGSIPYPTSYFFKTKQNTQTSRITSQKEQDKSLQDLTYVTDNHWWY